MKRVAAVLLLALAASCSSDKGIGPADSGTISFTFTGGGGGSFSASGAPTDPPQFSAASSWAAGYIDASVPESGIGGVQRLSSTQYHAAIISATRTTVGNSTIDSDCDPSVGQCTGMALILNATGEFDTFSFICILESGSVQITQISGGRMQGTFSGTGICIDNSFNTTVFTVSGGSFNVPLVDPPVE